MRYKLVPVGLLLASGAASGQSLETVEVVGTTPLGAAMDVERMAAHVQQATAEQLRERGALDLADYLRRGFAGVFVNEAQNNPLQPDLQYRGFVGSPLLGLPQGLAVYQDGVRVNEPFGDTVSWALIPQSAIATIALQPGSNPLFGLNALGGAIAIETKNGFSHAGTAAELSGGSFGRRSLQAETGGSSDGGFGYFVTGSRFEEDGWRDYSPSEATQLFANLGWRLGGTTLNASLLLADTDLIGNGAAPVQLLEIDRGAIFTRPDQTRNDLTLLTLSGTRALGERWELTGNVYYRESDVSTYNGDDSDFEACEDFPGLLCEEEDDEEEIVLDPLGVPVPALPELEGATVNRTSTEQEGSGIGLQAAWSGTLAGRDNRLVLGVAYDESDIGFAASTELGTLDATRLALPGGYFVGEAFTLLGAETANASWYFSNTLALSNAAALTLSGRYNRTDVTLRDRLGTALDGDHSFRSFNPAIGLTVRLPGRASFFAGYSESNRAPSPVELTCADEDDPCRLPNAFLADPPLEQVIASTYETGVRGAWGNDERGGGWHASLFRTTNDNDILFVSAGALTNEGYFDNVGKTRRQGLELALDGGSERLGWFASFTLLDATFRDAFAVPSPNNPAATDGEIAVEPGDRLPLVPRRLVKGGVRAAVTPKLTIGGDVVASSSQHYRGDEGNLLEPLDGYAILSFRAEYRFDDRAALYFSADNVLDTEYETFGTFGEPDEVLGDDFEDPRFLGPGAPRAGWIGVRVRF